MWDVRTVVICYNSGELQMVVGCQDSGDMLQ